MILYVKTGKSPDSYRVYSTSKQRSCTICFQAYGNISLGRCVGCQCIVHRVCYEPSRRLSWDTSLCFNCNATD